MQTINSEKLLNLINLNVEHTFHVQSAYPDFKVAVIQTVQPVLL